MSDYLKPVRGKRENGSMLFAAYAIICLAWTIGAGIFSLVAEIVYKQRTEPWQEFLVSFSQFIPIFAAVLGAVFLIRRKPVTLITSDEKFSIKRFIFGILSWGGLLLIGSLISWSADPSSLKFTFNAATFIPALAVLIIFLPIQVSTEELFFRGLIPQSLSRSSLPSAFVIAISTLLFAVPHLLNPEAQGQLAWSLIAYSSMGFGWLMAAKWAGGLEIAIGAHLINNFFGLAIVGYENSVVKPSSIWVGPASQMQNTAIALWITVGIWLLIVKKFKATN